jgi:hypothetical protein
LVSFISGIGGAVPFLLRRTQEHSQEWPCHKNQKTQEQPASEGGPYKTAAKTKSPRGR